MIHARTLADARAEAHSAWRQAHPDRTSLEAPACHSEAARALGLLLLTHRWDPVALAYLEAYYNAVRLSCAEVTL